MKVVCIQRETFIQFQVFKLIRENTPKWPKCVSANYKLLAFRFTVSQNHHFANVKWLTEVVYAQTVLHSGP